VTPIGSPLTPIRNGIIQILKYMVNYRIYNTLQEFASGNGAHFSVDFTQWTASGNDAIIKASIKTRSKERRGRRDGM